MQSELSQFSGGSCSTRASRLGDPTPEDPVGPPRRRDGSLPLILRPSTMRPVQGPHGRAPAQVPGTPQAPLSAPIVGSKPIHYCPLFVPFSFFLPPPVIPASASGGQGSTHKPKPYRGCQHHIRPQRLRGPVVHGPSPEPPPTRGSQGEGFKAGESSLSYGWSLTHRNDRRSRYNPVVDLFWFCEF